MKLDLSLLLAKTVAKTEERKKRPRGRLSEEWQYLIYSVISSIQMHTVNVSEDRNL